MRYSYLPAALLLMTLSCAKPNDTAADSGAPEVAPGSDRATAAAAVSNAIAANPTAADSILKANGFTADEFQREMYEIAADSALSASYAAAKR